jgi:hypothetical protein
MHTPWNSTRPLLVQVIDAVAPAVHDSPPFGLVSVTDPGVQCGFWPDDTDGAEHSKATAIPANVRVERRLHAFIAAAPGPVCRPSLPDPVDIDKT